MARSARDSSDVDYWGASSLLVEALNPKTAAFFLAFIPQLIDPSAKHCRAVRRPWAHFSWA
jgi:threonine/homoserine/homoserine lactone efflux protein